MLAYSLTKMVISIIIVGQFINYFGFWEGLIISIIPIGIANFMLKNKENKLFEKQTQKLNEWKQQQKEYEKYKNDEEDKLKGQEPIEIRKAMEEKAKCLLKKEKNTP